MSEPTLRLSKRMSELGLCSRREADEWIAKGWVRVDGRVISELGTKILPDQKITIEREVSTEGDRIALQISWTGTHTGPFLGVPPTGRTVTVPGTGIFSVVDGKIAEEWMLEDFLGIYQQITAP